MKSIGMKFKIALIAMAALSLLMAPAFSVPFGKGAVLDRPDGRLCSMGNMTLEEMGNMTLGELREMRQQPMNNSMACLAGNEGQNGNQKGNRMIAREGPRGDDGRCGAFGGREFGESRLSPRGCGFSLLLLDDLTADELGNMTLNQIKELQQKKMEELGNMTFNEINSLRQKKMQALNNMTLNELMAKQGNMPGIMKGWANL